MFLPLCWCFSTLILTIHTVGHRSSDCPKGKCCRNCDQEGHTAKECPEPRKMERVQCRNCDEMGHDAKGCPKPRDSEYSVEAYVVRKFANPQQCLASSAATARRWVTTSRSVLTLTSTPTLSVVMLLLPRLLPVMTSLAATVAVLAVLAVGKQLTLSLSACIATACDAFVWWWSRFCTDGR